MFINHCENFDTKLSKVENLNWLPWIGKYYEKTRILVLGDSYYDDKDESEWLKDKLAPRHLVNNQGMRSFLPQFSNAKFFRKIEQTVLSKDNLTFEERGKFWSSVAYFNLVQRLLPSRDNSERPKQLDFDIGWKVVLDVVDILDTDIVLKLGIDGIGRLGFHLSNNHLWERNAIEFYQKPRIINIKKGEKKVKIIFINHPTGSRAYDYKYWSDILKVTEPSLKEKLDL